MLPGGKCPDGVDSAHEGHTMNVGGPRRMGPDGSRNAQVLKYPGDLEPLASWQVIGGGRRCRTRDRTDLAPVHERLGPYRENGTFTQW